MQIRNELTSFNGSGHAGGGGGDLHEGLQEGGETGGSFESASCNSRELHHSQLATSLQQS